jgi:hypothetical protein
MFDFIKKGKRRAAWRGLIYGEGGLGKSTLASKMPEPLFIEGEAGGLQLDVSRNYFDLRTERSWPTSWEELNARIDEIGAAAEARKKLPFQTLVLDGFSNMEQLCIKYVCRKNNWASLSVAGYGKGEVSHHSEMVLFRSKLERIWTSYDPSFPGVNVCMVCSVADSKYLDNETGAEYKRTVPGLLTAKNADVSGSFFNWCDFVLYCEKQITIGKNADTKKAYAVGGQHVMHTRLAAGHVAKCRFDGVDETLPLDWNTFWSQVERGESPEKMQAYVLELAAKAPDDKRSQVEQFSKTPGWKDIGALGKWVTYLKQAA